jgi:ribonuclease P/MRP protein subunit POP1
MRKRLLSRNLPKAGKNKRIKKTVSFLKRQRMYIQSTNIVHLLIWNLGDKVWLETHIWHAKRMKMENMWGYRLVRVPFPQGIPSEKSLTFT